MTLVEQTQYGSKADLAPAGRYVATLVGAEEYSGSEKPGAFYFFWRFKDEMQKTHIAGIVLNTVHGKDKRFDKMLDCINISHGMFSIIKLSSILGATITIRITHGETKTGRYYHKIEEFYPLERREVAR